MKILIEILDSKQPQRISSSVNMASIIYGQNRANNTLKN